MNPIQLSVRVYILTLYPQNISGRPSAASGDRPSTAGVRALANGLAIPSFWRAAEIDEAFAVANRVWAQAAIEFRPSISERDVATPADENGMWATFVNQLTPPSGLAVAFVHQLPPGEGGWGGGRIAVVARTENAIRGFHGHILAHELGHVLPNTPGHVTETSNLMSGRRHPRVVTADLLDPDQIASARAFALAM